MIMKTYKLILAAAMTAMAVACTDKFLTVEHPTAMPIEDYFTTEGHLAEALVAAYDPLQWPDW